MKKNCLALLVFFTVALTSCSSKSVKDIMGIEIGSRAEAVYNNLDADGWTRIVNKRSYELYQKSSYNSFKNPVLMLFYSGKGTGSFAYSSLTLNLYDENDEINFASFLDDITEVNSLKLTLKKDFNDGKLKKQIEEGSPDTLRVLSYSVTLYQNENTLKLGKDSLDVILITLNMYDLVKNCYYTEQQVYSVGKNSQETVAKQLFEGSL